MGTDQRVKRNQYYRKTHGVSLKQINAQLYRQALGCAICGTPLQELGNSDRPDYVVDHDHATGKTRALLCTRCNTGLGKFFDDPELLHIAAEYLLSFK